MFFVLGHQNYWDGTEYYFIIVEYKETRIRHAPCAG